MKKIKCELISWRRSYELAKKLARKIKISNYKPDLVIAIGRGGFTPARIVCDYLALEDLTSIRLEHWGSAEVRGKAKLRFPLRANIKGKKVLIVDDITDTGETLELAVKHVSSQKPSELKTAVLQHKIVSKFLPDYIAHKLVKWRWVIYPWAIYEDFSRFIVRILEGKGMSDKQILTELRKNFNVELSLKDLKWILEELKFDGKIIKNKKEYWHLVR